MTIEEAKAAIIEAIEEGLPLALAADFDKTIEKIMDIIEEVRQNDFYNNQ